MRTALSCWNCFSSRGSVVVFKRRERRERHELAVRPGDVDLRELIRRQPLGALDLRDHLVAAPLDAEPVDVVAAEQRREIAAGLAQVDALRAQLVAIEDDLGLRLVELQVGVGEHEQAARERLLHELFGELAQLLRLGRRGDHEIDREVAAARAAAAAPCGITRTPAIFDSGPIASIMQLLRRLRPLAPRLGHHAAEAAVGRRDLEDAARSPGTTR